MLIFALCMQIFYNNYGDIMKVLSIKEPYASLIMMNIKKIETRSFKTKYRGELYIHASLSKSNQNSELSKKIRWSINVDIMKLVDMHGFWKI